MAGMSPAERKVFARAAKALGHNRDTLNGDASLTSMLQQIARQVAQGMTKDAADQLGEVLFDLAHETCDKGCAGAGAPWYRTVAQRLTDPYGPLAAIAIEQQIARDETGNPDGKETLDNTAWLGLLHQHYQHVLKGGDNDQMRQRLISTAALIVEWLHDLARSDAVAWATHLTRH